MENKNSPEETTPENVEENTSKPTESEDQPQINFYGNDVREKVEGQLEAEERKAIEPHPDQTSMEFAEGEESAPADKPAESVAEENEDIKIRGVGEKPEQAAPPPPPETPAKKEQSAEEPPKKKKKKKKSSFSLIGCLGGLLTLYILTIILGIFILWLNKDNTAFLGNFGLINDAELKDFLLVAINWSFFPVALLFLILVVIGVFIFLTAKKEQKERKRTGLRMILINLVALFLVIPFWVGVYNFVYNLQVSSQRIVAEIIVSPEDTSDLVAPTTIDFSTANIQKVINRRGFDIDRIIWDFDGDNDFETQTQDVVVSHLFNAPGTYKVQVKIILTDGQEGIYDKTINIPKGSFKVDPKEGDAPLEVSFDAKILTEGQRIKTFRWDFDGDLEFDQEGSDSVIKHTYAKIGDYKATLQTIDVNNVVKNFTQTIRVNPGDVIELKPKITISPGEEGVVPYKVQLSGSDSESPLGDIKSYEWNFGDASPPQKGANVNHVFEEAGTFTVTLTITDEADEKAKAEVEVIVTETKTPPEAVISTKPAFDEGNRTLSGGIPLDVEFDGGKSKDKDDNIVEYAWDFDGDGEYDSFGSKASHSYKEAGQYKATLKVMDADDQESTISITIDVGAREAKAVITATPEAGPIPLTVEFDGSQSTTSDGSSIVNYEWDFGDGTPVIPTGAQVSHKYDNIGTYTVKLRVFSESGEEAEATKEIYARVVPLQACFEPSRERGKSPLTVTFDAACSQGGIQKWEWNFGDGFTSDNRRPTHTFKSSGNFTVNLEVTDNKNTVSSYSSVIMVTD